MAEQQFEDQLKALNDSSNRYIDEIIAQAQGDRDMAIGILTRDHNQALGADDGERAKFLEGVADKLEERIGRIPYDYQVSTERVNEDLNRTTEITTRNRDQALARLLEDEQVWKQQFNRDAVDARASQQEALLQRGILQGTRDNAQGIAGQEVRNLEQDLGNTLSAYERALGRTRQDTNQVASDTLFDANRASGRTLQDLKTGARRGAQEATDSMSDGKNAAERAFQKQKALLEKQKEMAALQNKAISAKLTYEN